MTMLHFWSCYSHITSLFGHVIVTLQPFWSRYSHITAFFGRITVTLQAFFGHNTVTLQVFWSPPSFYLHGDDTGCKKAAESQ